MSKPPKPPQKRIRSSSRPTKPRVDLKPSEALIEAWRPIEAACVAQILGTDANSKNLWEKPFVTVNFGEEFSSVPKYFPSNDHGRDGSGRVTLRAETLLLWLYVERLSEYTPAMLFKRRGKVLSKQMEINCLLDNLMLDMELEEVLECNSVI